MYDARFCVLIQDFDLSALSDVQAWQQKMAKFKSSLNIAQSNVPYKYPQNRSLRGHKYKHSKYSLKHCSA